MNLAAQALGRMAKGVPKTLTDSQRKFRAGQLAAARKKRHEIPKPSSESANAEVSEGGTRDSRIETAAQSRPSLH